MLDPASPLVLGPAAVSGFVAGPLFYVLLGLELRDAVDPASRTAARATS